VARLAAVLAVALVLLLGMLAAPVGTVDQVAPVPTGFSAPAPMVHACPTVPTTTTATATTAPEPPTAVTNDDE
jgi:hypothetical protein